MNKKYKLLTSETKEWCGITLHRIEYLKDFADVEKGEKGGWIEKEENLSQEDDARVSGNAQVYGNARVSGNAWVSGNARVSGNAYVSGNARVSGELKLIGGYFYHIKQKSEEIEKIELDEDNELLCSEPEQAEENKPEVNLSGLEVKVTVEGKEYTATIK